MLKRFLSLPLAFVGTSLFAWEIDTSTDLSLTFDAFRHGEVVELAPTQQPPSFVLNGQADVFWNAESWISDSWVINLRYGLSARSILDTNGSAIDNSEGSNYRVDDLPSEIEPRYFQNLDLLNTTVYSGMGDVTFGRQAISFGQAKFYSPIDVLQPSSLFATNSSYRPGVDAARGIWAVGAVSELDAGYVFGRDSAYFGRLKTYFLNSDWEAIALYINDDILISSIGSNSSFGNVGWWQETAVLHSQEEWNIRATLGADYTFFDDWFVMAEIHYNGVGESDDYSPNLSKPLYQLGAVIPQAKLYASAQTSYTLNILTQLSMGASVNVDDGSGLVNGSVDFSASDSLSVNASIIIPFAERSSLSIEYGPAPVMAILGFDWVF